MALDEALMECAENNVILRIYSWEPPAISLGYFQPYAEFRKFAGEHSIVRRVTGGGAIFHAHELTYSITCRLKPGSPFASIPRTYGLVHNLFSAALAELGYSSRMCAGSTPVSDIPDSGFCFYKSVSADVLSRNRKLLGSAQRRSGDKFLMHGSLVIGRNPITKETAYLTDDSSEVPQLCNSISLRFRDSLGKAIGLQFHECEPTEDELSLTERLIKDKFANPAWTCRR
ncbi:MAG: lipoate--protein ligase family protein [Planctomycetota bacterium]